MATSEYDPLLPQPRFSTHPAQEEAVKSDARFRILEWGRRGGKNITAVMDLIERARHPWTSSWGNDDPQQVTMWWVGRSYDQAEKYGFNKMRSAVPNSWMDGEPKRSEPYQIDFTNGVSIEFRTYDHPETLQGAGVDHISVDEADYMPDTLWWDDLEPMLMDSKGSAMFISKPVRPRSYFQQLKERGQSDQWGAYYYSHVTSADNPFIAENPADKRGTMPDHKFRQQYLAELPDDGGEVFDNLDDTVFTWADVPVHGEMVGDGNAVTGEVYVAPDDAVEPFAVGADFAQHRDYRVTGALDARGRLVYLKRSQNESWRDVQAHLEAVHDRYPGVLVPDATRDNKIIADLWNAGVNLEPVKFSPQEKRALIEDLITAVETGEITVPDDPRFDQLRLEMRMLEREVTGHGYTKYHAPESGFDDCVDMLALANRGRSSAAGAASTTARVGGREESSGDGLDAVVQEQQRRRRNKWK